MRRGHLTAWVLALGGVVAWGASLAEARIKLITLPVRERVEIQLDHPNATLVEEERIVPLVKGVNQVDFSWANTQIDSNTIVFRVVGAAGDGPRAPVGTRPDPAAPAPKGLEVKVLSVSYPPNEAALVWQVASNESGSARVRISYLLGNLSKSFNYRAVATHNEETLVLSQFMRLQNFANEEFLSTAAPTSGANLWAGWGRHFMRPVGLNQTMEMLVEKYQKVPVKKTYTCDPSEFDYLDRAQFKLRVPMHYVIKNDKKSNLGTAPLPFGKVRIFIEPKNPNDPDASTTFLGEDWGKFTPIDDEMRLYLGVAQDVVVKRTIEKNERVRVAGNLYNQVVVLKYEIENFKDKPVTLDVAENLRAVRSEVIGDTGRDVQWDIGPDTNFENGLDKEKSTFEKVVFHADLPARDQDGKAKKVTHKLHVVFRNEW